MLYAGTDGEAQAAVAAEQDLQPSAAGNSGFSRWVTKAQTGASRARLLDWIQKAEDSVTGASDRRLQQLQHIMNTATHSIQQMMSQDTALERRPAPQRGVLMPNPDAPLGNSLARLRNFIDPKRRRKQPAATAAQVPFIIQPRRKQRCSVRAKVAAEAAAECSRSSQGAGAPAPVRPAAASALTACPQHGLNAMQGQAPPEQGAAAEPGRSAAAYAALAQVAEQRVAGACQPFAPAVASALGDCTQHTNTLQVHGPAVQGEAAAGVAVSQLGEERAARACRAARKPSVEPNKPAGARKSVRERRPPPQHGEYMEDY